MSTQLERLVFAPWRSTMTASFGGDSLSPSALNPAVADVTAETF
jgi:hypothetical protein